MALEGRSLAIFIVSIVMMTLSIATVSLRTFVRLKVVRAFGWDDASMITAMVCSMVKLQCDLVLNLEIVLVVFHPFELLLYHWIDERRRPHIHRLHKCRGLQKGSPGMCYPWI